MGCGKSKTWNNRPQGSTIASLEYKNSLPNSITKEYGHPSINKETGYDFGIRSKVKGNKLSVHSASAKSNDQRVMIKEYHLKYYSEAHAVKETYILADLMHESLPKLHAIFFADSSLFMVMEYMDTGRLSNLVDWKKRVSTLSSVDIKQITLSLASAVNYVHDKRYIIRNLFPENIMLRREGDHYQVKLTDLSYTVPFGSNESISDHPLFDWSDVPFTSPEALLGFSYNQSMDIWSLGVLLYLMLTYSLPFSHNDDKTLVHSIKMAAYSYDINSSVDYEARDLVAHMLKANFADRCTAKDILKDPWFIHTN